MKMRMTPTSWADTINSLAQPNGLCGLHRGVERANNELAGVIWGSACRTQLLLGDELASHEDVVDVAAVKEELCSKDALDREATGLVQQPGTGVGTQDAEAQLVCAAALCLLHGRLDEPATGTVALSLRINCQPVESQHMIVRRERDRLTELQVADDNPQPRRRARRRAASAQRRTRCRQAVQGRVRR